MTDPAIQFVLASASPRRQQMLRALGFRFECLPADCDETPQSDEAPIDLVRRLAILKANAVSAHTRLPILAADTLIERDGAPLGKPTDRDHAASMLQSLTNRSHIVHTAVALLHAGEIRQCLTSTEVTFRALQPQEILAYCNTGEPDDKAGAYAIQGIGASFVSRIVGSYSGVVGLPLAETIALLAEFDIRPDLQSASALP